MLRIILIFVCLLNLGDTLGYIDIPDCLDFVDGDGMVTAAVVAGTAAQTKQSLTVREIANKMAVSDATVRLWINTGKLVAYKFPGSGAQSIIRVKAEDFEKFLRAYRADSVVV